jgi:hypothetical protein
MTLSTAAGSWKYRVRKESQQLMTHFNGSKIQKKDLDSRRYPDGPHEYISIKKVTAFNIE